MILSDSRPALKRFVYLLVMMPVAWVVGLFIFINYIPETEVVEVEPVDAVVILTGGAMRMENGIELFHKIKAKKLLISGVAPGINKSMILAKLDNQTLASELNPDDVILGNMAYNTNTNSLEAKIFMQHHGFKSMVLVTSNYHIIRSMRAFVRDMPDILIIPYPICSKNFRKFGNFISYNSMHLAIREYNKLLFFYVLEFDRKIMQFYQAYLDLVYSLIHPILFEKDRSQPD